jgi:ribulose-5-phosphate 4-epimerase/fuculose-1-phosphate aldolase
MKPTMHPDEWPTRVKLAACYRVFAILGWTKMIYNHTTLRLPDSATNAQKQFLINPFGLHYSEVTAIDSYNFNSILGKAVELDALVGAVKQLGQLTQVATTYTDSLLGLARLHARVRGLY